MQNRAGSWLFAVLLSAALAVGGFVVGAESRESDAATRSVLAQVVDPKGGKGRTLALSRVRIPGRTALVLHRHPGHQVAYVERGTLTYTVRRGVVEVFRGAADSDPEPVRSIRAGHTGPVRAHEWVVEKPGDVHFGANRGEKPVLILLATLFTNDRPAAIPVAE